MYSSSEAARDMACEGSSSVMQFVLAGMLVGDGEAMCRS
jgi:hypothetical protein